MLEKLAFGFVRDSVGCHGEDDRRLHSWLPLPRGPHAYIYTRPIYIYIAVSTAKDPAHSAVLIAFIPRCMQGVHGGSNVQEAQEDADVEGANGEGGNRPHGRASREEPLAQERYNGGTDIQHSLYQRCRPLLYIYIKAIYYLYQRCQPLLFTHSLN